MATNFHHISAFMEVKFCNNCTAEGFLVS